MMLLRPWWELKSPMNLQGPHFQGHFNVISSYVLFLQLPDLRRDWEGDGEGDQRHRKFKEGRVEWGTPLGASGVKIFGDAEKRKLKMS